jgi:hypothetical protein
VPLRYYSCPTWLLRHLPQIDARSYNPKYSVSGLVRVGNVTELSKMLHHDSLNLSDVYWATIISEAWGRSKSPDKWDRIHKIWLDLRDMDKINAVVIATYLDLCGFYGSLNCLNEAWGFLNQEKPWIIVDNHYNSYIQALIKLGASEDALRTLQTMQVHRITCKTLVTIIGSLRRKSDINQEILENCWKWIEKNGLIKTIDKQETRFSREWKRLVRIQNQKRFRQ